MKRFLLALLGGMIVSHASAQLVPLQAQYYANKYLVNPAAAGTEAGMNLNLGYRKLWNTIPGSPVAMHLTGDYGFGRVGAGIQLQHETAGFQKQTRLVGTFAYHLPINDLEGKLHFGLNAGLMSQRIDRTLVVGEQDDVLLDQYDNRPAYFDGDFGMAYTDGALTVQAAFPNLKALVKKDGAANLDRAKFYTALAYRFAFGAEINAVGIEPLVALRGIRHSSSLADFGVRADFADRKIFVGTMYDTSKRLTLNLGYQHDQKYLLNFSYSRQSGGLPGYNNGNFELHLGANLGNMF